MFVDAGASLDAKDSKGCTSIHFAAHCGAYFVAKHLYQLGADVHALDSEGGSLLHHTSSNHFPDPGFFDTLISIGLDANARDNQGRTPLHRAASDPHNWENIQVLLKAGADVNARDNEGQTPLHYATHRATPHIVKRLMAVGADEGAFDAHGDTPLAVGARKGSYQGIRYLLSAGVTVPANIINILRPEPVGIQGSLLFPLINTVLSMMKFFRKLHLQTVCILLV
ncbi:hypothetical protein BOTBODRAFT_158684 [Botryobasidium botryosum FD-172 SS1]|uniref:Uncharacterized protein n=1 Tax=Botryobasidium botryosum (strain FD-172 SS1) TaxID=930990 RepID=A0A067MT59_BOTB1|nr:hypothetical protein BOTBODRAFT_158684 [Botryobasidium botryosum FD-172 SS1]